MENLLSKGLLFLSEVKAGQKQGVELQGRGCWSSLGAELVECSSRREETLGGAQALQHCRPVLGRAAAQLTPPSSPPRQRRMKLKDIFLCFPKLPGLPMCFSLCVLLSYARECLDPFLATEVLYFLPSAEGPAWPVFACRVTPGFSP